MDSYYKFKNFELIYKTTRSTIVKCNHKLTEKPYILKAYELDIDAKELIYIMNEVKISIFVNHDNIIKTYSYFYESSKIFFVQEFAEKGDLINIKSLYQTGKIPEDIVKKQYIKPLLNAVEYLHDNNIIHCDIKPENILIMGDGTLKLCDLGLAIDTNIHTPNKFLGTAEFMAPEIVGLNKEVGYDEAVDMWAIGCVTYELIFGISPFFDNNVENVYYNIIRSPVNFINGIDISSDCMEFILKLLTKDPIIRMNIKEAQQCNFITKEQPRTAKRESLDKNHNNRSSIHAGLCNITTIQRVNKDIQNDALIVPKRANSEPGKTTDHNPLTASPIKNSPQLKTGRKFNLLFTGRFNR